MKRFNYYKPSLSEAWKLVVVLMVGMVLIGGILSFIWKDAPEMVVYGVSMLVPILYALFKGGRRLAGGAKPFPVEHTDLGGIRPLPYAILLAVAMVAIVFLMDPATAFIPMPDFFKRIFEEAFVNKETWDLVLSTCILAPLFEELLCRGIILRGLLANGLSARSAILWSAFFFAFIHFNPWQSIPAFAIAIFFGWIYWRTGSLLSTIALHALNNSISCIITGLFPDMSVDTSFFELMPTGLYIVFYIAALALLFMAVSLLDRKLPESCIKNSTL